MDSRFDDLLHTVIVEKGQGIYGFFDVVFGFMYKRTDFFYEMAPGENMGFFPTQAEALVYNYFRKYQALHYKERVPKRDIDPKEIEEFMKRQKEAKEQKLNNVATNKVEISEVKSLPVEKGDEIKLTSKKVEEIKLTQKDVGEIKLTKVPEVNNTVSLPKPEVKKVDTSISTYNGDQCEKYNWSQGVMDVMIQFKLPEGTNKRMVRKPIINNLKKLA